MGRSNGKKVIIITSIHPSIHPSIQLPLKVCFNFVHIYICGGLDGLIGCEESLVQWLDVKKANLLWCPSIHPSIQHRLPPPNQDVCFLLVWGGGSDGWTGWSDRMWRKLIIVTSYRLVTSVRPTISLKPANYFLFRNLPFLFCFVFFLFWSVFVPSLVSSHPGIPTITGLQLVMSWFRHVEKASF
jgi:hypothetical protein